jgi:hypothetical protein
LLCFYLRLLFSSLSFPLYLFINTFSAPRTLARTYVPSFFFYCILISVSQACLLHFFFIPRCTSFSSTFSYCFDALLYAFIYLIVNLPNVLVSISLSQDFPLLAYMPFQYRLSVCAYYFWQLLTVHFVCFFFSLSLSSICVDIDSFLPFVHMEVNRLLFLNQEKLLNIKNEGPSTAEQKRSCKKRRLDQVCCPSLKPRALKISIQSHVGLNPL